MKICVTNGKGGTGKTTLTVFLMEFLYRRGKKILVIDLDANCCVSEVYGKLLQEETSRLLLVGQDVTPYAVKQNDAGGRIDIIPAELNLSMLSNIKDTQVKFQIKKQGFDEKYDYVFIDPPGTWSAHNRNAVFAADTVVVCGKCSKLDFAATVKYMNELESCCLDSEIFVVCNSYNARHDPDNILQKYEETFKDFLLPEPVPMLNSFNRLVNNNNYKIQTNIEKRLENFVKAIVGEGV